MSVEALKEALGTLSTCPEHAHFVGPRDAQLIDAAEQAVSFTFPPSYRHFVERLGAGSFGSFEVYGVVDGNFARSAIPNGPWLALQMRRRGELADNLLPICDTGLGGYYCIERRDACYPVVIVEGPPDRHTGHEIAAPDFGEFFLHGVKQQLRWLRN